MGVVSMNEMTPSALIPQMKDVKWTNETMAYAFVMIFGLLWIVITLDYCKNFVILYASSTYYYNSPVPGTKTEENPEGDDGEAEVMEGFKFAHIYHLGGITFAALIITIIKVIRFLFVYLAKKAVAASGQEDTACGKAAICMIKCGECILKCLEKICDYINNAGLAYMAVTGDSFCRSAYNGFLLNLKHASAFALAKYFATFLILLGKAGVTMLNVFTCFALIKAM